MKDMVSCILLSAGSSQRFGSPKALAKINGATAIEHLQSTLVQSEAGEIIIVLGAGADQIKPYLFNHTKVKFVYNKDYNLGQTSSFKAGLSVVSDAARGILLQPVDTPFVKTETVNLIIHQFEKIECDILIPTHNRHKGHPPVFHVKNKKALLALPDAIGLNQFEHEHEAEIRLFPVEDPGAASSFNTPEEFEEIKMRFTGSRQT